MKKQIRKFLEFNGKAISFLSIDGQYWVAIKPICEALGVDWSRQYKNLKMHRFFSSVQAVQPMHDSSDRLQRMIAIPERYVYGWIFQIKSASKELVMYQQECCDILYDHFHGIIGSRREIIQEKIELQQKIAEAEKALQLVPEYKNLQDLRAGVMRTGKSLKELDNVLISEQLSIFQS